MEKSENQGRVKINLYQNCFFTTIILLLVLSSCSSPAAQQHRASTHLASAVEEELTVFVPTLEEPIDMERNAVYTASLPLAWRTLLADLGGNVSILDKFPDLQRLHRTPSVDEALEEGDYERQIERSDSYIKVTTKQVVDLTFEPIFERFDNSLLFDSVPIAAFGSRGAQNILYEQTLEVMSYRDDHHFAIRIQPREQAHEIWLYKTDRSFASLAEMYGDLLQEKHYGTQQKTVDRSRWRYVFTEFDELSIPCFRFDLDHRYSRFSGAQFVAKGNNYTVSDVLQRIGFVMHEAGARVESEAAIIVNMGIVPDDEMPKPKLLAFDSPFYVVAKKRNTRSPYMVLYVKNAELLEREGSLL